MSFPFKTPSHREDLPHGHLQLLAGQAPLGRSLHAVSQAAVAKFHGEMDILILKDLPNVCFSYVFFGEGGDVLPVLLLVVFLGGGGGMCCLLFSIFSYLVCGFACFFFVFGFGLCPFVFFFQTLFQHMWFFY